MLTAKDRSELRSQANILKTTVIIGKSGITDSLKQDVNQQLEARELIKGEVLETSLMTPGEASEQLCTELGAEGIQIVGNKFVIYRKSKDKNTGTAKASPKKRNPVEEGIKRRRAAVKKEREERNEFFKKKAIEASIEKSREQAMKKKSQNR